MTEPTTNKSKAKWQLFTILGFEAVITAAAIWVGFVTNNWAPVIAVIMCAGAVTALMLFANKNAKD
ncbi:MAG: hypothetical protein Hens3KO_07090 [Henriciella sp.]